MKGIPHPSEIPIFHKTDNRTLDDIRKEALKNPYIPGPRIIRHADTRKAYISAAGCTQWLYPLSEVNDFGFFAYIEKDASSDIDRSWASEAHPDAVLYVMILEGEGSEMCIRDRFLKLALI